MVGLLPVLLMLALFVALGLRAPGWTPRVRVALLVGIVGVLAVAVVRGMV